MPGQVADRPELQALRRLPADGERVRVGEAQRTAHLETARRKPPADRGDAIERWVLQDHPGERACVLGVQVDVTMLERASGDTGAAEAELPLDARLAGGLDHLRGEFGEEIALGERLRADADD